MVSFEQRWALQRSCAGQFIVFLKGFVTLFGGQKAPLICVLPIPFYLIFGTSYLSAMLVNIVLIIGMGIVTYKLVYLLDHSMHSAFFALIILYTLPLFHEFSRQFMIEYGLSFLVLVSIYNLLQSNYLNDKKRIRYLGILFGLGLLMKVTYAFFLTCPYFIFIIQALRLKKNSPKNLISALFRILLIGFAVASIWYIPNIQMIFHYAFQWSFGKSVKIFGGLQHPDPFSYLLAYFYSGISPYYFFLLFILAVATSFFRRTQRLWYISYGLVIIVWLIVPIAFFSFALNNQIRFSLPCLAAFPVILGILLRRTSEKNGIIFLALPLFATIINPFLPLPSLVTKFFSPPTISQNDWMIHRVISVIAEKKGMDNIVLCTVDHPYYNNFTLDYYAKLAWKPQRFFNLNFLKNSDDALFVLEKADIALLKTENPGPDFSNRFHSQIQELLKRNEQHFRIFARFPLPDQSILFIFERIR